MIEYIFQKELVLITQTNQKSATFVITGIFLDKNFKYEPYLYNGCHDLMQKAINLNDVAVVFVKRNDD